jgi:hypothetical protein
MFALPAKLANLRDAYRAAPDKTTWLYDQLRWRYFTLAYKRHARANWLFDRQHGVDTAGEIALDLAGVPEKDVARGNGIYRALTESAFREAIESIQIDYAKYTFIDIGSGKGKLLLLASRYGFREIIGVEYALSLHETALHNVAIYGAANRVGMRIKPVHADALTYELPDGPLILFVFNALARPFMRTLLQRVDLRVGLMPAEPLFLIYANVRNVNEMSAEFDVLSNLKVVCRNRNYLVVANRRMSDVRALTTV